MEIEQTQQNTPGLPGTEGQQKERGFTLIELSIVLVIIGLIVGGILVGQDLIRAAEIRATVGQIEKYNSAVNTFRTKFNGIPGDLNSTDAAAFGFTARDGLVGEGDGNGLLQGSNGGAVTNEVFGQEIGILWNDLSVANLLDGSFTTNAANLDASGVAAVTAVNVPNVFPAARLARGNYVTAGASVSINYWFIAGIGGVTANTGVYTLTPRLTPIESYNMDIKLDDGLPWTGIVQAHGIAGAASTTPLSSANSGGGASGNCTVGTGSSTTDTYNRNLSTGGIVPACMLRFRFN